MIHEKICWQTIFLNYNNKDVKKTCKASLIMSGITILTKLILY